MRRFGIALAATALLAGCESNHNDIAQPLPNDPVNTGLTPPVPAITNARVGDAAVTLDWSVDDATNIGSYRVYRSSPTRAEERVATGIDATTYADANLSNGTPYSYRVAAVLSNGLEGDKSDPVTAVPTLLSVLIENGDDFANDRTIIVQLTGPAGATAFRIGETADLSGESWRPFSSSASFTLSAGDGLRTVYVQFRDTVGNESEVVSDTVTLDTVAEILSVTHDAGAAPISPGTIIRFEIDAGEADGEATIDIGGAQSGLRLFDDGAHGDGAAGDGVYALDFEVPIGSETSEAAVTGNFTDAAGNFAEPKTASTRITINAPPAAVTLDDPFNVQATSLSLSWSQNLEEDFFAYRLFRAETMNVLADPDRILVAEISSNATTSQSDEDLTENTTYFYVVQTVDDFGSTAVSNTVTATTANDPPPPLSVSSSASTSVSVTLEWEPTEIADFASYRVLRSDSGTPGTFTEVAQLSQQSTNSHTDFFTAVTSTTTFFYKVRVVDSAAEQTDSNVVTVVVEP